MKQFNKPTNRASYRTPTPFPSSGDESGNVRAPGQDIGNAAKLEADARKFKLLIQGRSLVFPTVVSSDDEVEFVDMANNKTSDKPARFVTKDESNTLPSRKSVPRARFTYTKPGTSLGDTLADDADSHLDPSPAIIESARSGKDRPKPIPLFKKDKQPKSITTTDYISSVEVTQADDRDDSLERTPKMSRTVVHDDDATPLARSQRYSMPPIDPDITPKASRVRDSEKVDFIADTVVSSVRQTRASNGISKKRVLQDAAILSSDDDLPAHITPKKVKRNNAKAITPYEAPVSDDDDDEDRRADIEPLKLGVDKRHLSAVDNDSAIADSVSNGKRRAAIEDDDNCSTYNRPLPAREVDEDDVFASDMATATHLSLVGAKIQAARLASGRSSAGGSKTTEDPAEERLHPDEVAAIDAAMRKTRDDALRAAMDAKIAKASERAKSLLASREKEQTDRAKITSQVPDHAHNKLSAVATTPRYTFGQAVKTPGTTPMINAGAVLLEDTMKFRVASLPNRCDVTRSHLQDSLLSDDYALLPKLRLGALRPWNAPPGSGSTMISVWFSGWAVQCPNLDFETACAIIRMQKHKNFINPSRVSPLDVNIMYTSNDNKRSILQANFKTAVCLSPILTRDSYLLEPTTVGLRNKYISGHFHHQEWERLEAFACMVFDKKVMTAQIRDGALSFTTMGNVRGDREMSSPSRPPRNPSILSAASSRAHSFKSNIARPDMNVRSVLDLTDDIPVYDARGTHLDFGIDLEDMEERLPRWVDEIPSHSFAVVGYTMGHYEKDSRANLTTNILFVILLATEGSDE